MANMMQSDANRIINYRIDRAEACVNRRNASEYGSRAYWRSHDAYLAWVYRAERLIPASGRTVEYERMKGTNR